ncbi:MAG: BREX-1 system adenine-specific DNA-methyltransferase PglX, partial [Patescibacteria group bacterium]|nr:BREX-1 system adenine-specific DNA-methyltransferase PglX [Patescibacteria group bacterium]
MSEARSIIQSIINDFVVDKFIRFFREKSQKFIWQNFNLSQYNDDDFTDGTKIGEINFSETDSLVIISFKVKNSLSERSGKKAQYEKAKYILRLSENQKYSAGIFIFYDASGNFRFSLVYPESLGTKRQWSNFRRFTYFVSKNFTNKTFLQRIGDGDFSSLNSIKEAFSVDKVTEEFYKEISYWYFWACQVIDPPEGTKKQENGKEMFVIRLITRLIFVWFMKQKDSLIPNDLFNREKISLLLNDFSPQSSSYYKAILQNLFFATLSTEIKKRRFRDEFRAKNGWNGDFGNQYVYRYYDLFKSPQDIENYFKEIPFLNGGLFECLDNKDNDEYIDGFTERKKYQPNIPNLLFFTDEKNVDLNKDFGTKNKKYRVRGIIDILSSFNFTIDENTPDDQDVALDPELLGKVFENLLASFNPETATTARKATGSYYTPREIVDYMVTQSLKEYFKTHLSEIKGIKEKLDFLFSNTVDKNPFNTDESKKIIKLIDDLRIVDPAVGSGAFPMGILNKMVFILNKVDPDNFLWKKAQLDSAELIPDPLIRQKTIEKIEDFFASKNADYGRKLYLIQKCIYGVDIQEIAVEIAKLRFFISLLVDEKIDNQKENKGIEPLPNLDFKLMQGNSLIEHGSSILMIKGEDEEKNKLIDDYFKLKEKYFFTWDHQEKKELFNKINDLIIRLVNYDREKEYKKEKEKLEGFRAQTNIFGALPGENLSFEDTRPEVIKQIKKLEQAEEKIIKTGADHFEWHLYFSEVFEKGGFDIVIANPPYIQLQKNHGELANLYQSFNFKTFDRMGDIYTLFYEKGIELLKNGGILTYITSNKWLRAGYGKKIREFFINFEPLLLIDLGPNVFESAIVDTCILFVKKEKKQLNEFKGIDLKKEDKNNINLAVEKSEKIVKISPQPWFIGSRIEYRIKEKIEKYGKPLKDWNVKIYRGILTGLNEAFIIDNQKREEILANCQSEDERKRTEQIIKPILRGRDIKRYYYEWA